MSSLYAQYVLEREDKFTIETEECFAIYKVNGKDCYIQDVFVTKEARGKNLGKMLVDTIEQMAKEHHDCNRLLGSVDIQDKNATANMSIWLKQGWQLLTISGSLVYLKKDIN